MNWQKSRSLVCVTPRPPPLLCRKSLTQTPSSPFQDRVKKSLFDTISSTKSASASSSATPGAETKDGKADGAKTAASATAKPDAPRMIDGITQVKVELSKKQKRRMGKHLDEKGEKKRGWNWVDLVSHVCPSAFLLFVCVASSHQLVVLSLQLSRG
jgi:hypothetical protein